MAGPADRSPVTRPRGLAAFLLPLPVAAVAGLGAGLDPHTTLVVAAATASALVLVLRVEWAALALVGGAVFEDYLALVSPLALQWLAAVLITAWVVRRAQGPLHRHRLRVAVLPAAVLLGVVALAFAVHPTGLLGLAAVATYAGLVVVMLVLADCLCGPLDPRRAARVFVLACVAAGLCGIVTAVVSDRHRVVGPVENADVLAFFLVAAAPLVGTVRTRSDQPVWWVWACFAVLLVAGVGTQSRPALVALVGMVVVAVLTGLLAVRYASALLAVVATGAGLVIVSLPLPVGQALTDPQRYSDVSFAERNEARLTALRMTEEAPVLGLGPAAYAVFHGDFVDRGATQAPDRDVDTAYSTLLETSAEIGLLGAGALYAVWLVPALGLRRRWRQDRSQLNGSVLVALVGLLAASLWETRAFALPLWFLAALTLALGRPRPARLPLFAAGLERSTSGQVAAKS